MRYSDLVAELAKRQWQREIYRMWCEDLTMEEREEFTSFAEYLGEWNGDGGYAYDSAKDFERHKKQLRMDIRAMLADLKELKSE